MFKSLIKTLGTDGSPTLASQGDGPGSDMSRAKKTAPPELAAEPVEDEAAPALPPRITAITPMRNEGPFLLEWIAYHRIIGVNDFLVFTNDCTDGTDLMLERLDELGMVRHMVNPSFMVGSGRHHWSLLTYVNQLKRLRRSDWVISMDADEFICVNCGDGTLAALFEATGNPDVITMNQLNFGCSGRDRYEDHFVTQQFEHSEERVIERGRRGTKSLTRKGAPVTEWGNHSPMLQEGAGETVRWVNGSGEPIAPELLTKERKGRGEGHRQLKSLAPGEIGYDLVQLNHYAVRSMDSFMAKVSRGNANHPDLPADKKYWRMHNQNAVKDRRIQALYPALAEEVAWLKSDPELGALHEKAVAAHRAEIAALAQDPALARLREQIERMHERIWVRPQDDGAISDAAPGSP